jgi:RND family efflux transporter MFP subunit
VDLSFRVSGPLVDLPVNEGQEVEEGALIARIDPRDFKSQLEDIEGNLDQARAQLEAMRAGARTEDIKVLEANVQAAQAELEDAQAQFERYQKLYDNQAVAKADYDRVKKSRDVAQASLATAQQNLEKGRAGARQEDIDAQEAAIKSLEAKAEQARDALEDTELKAPFPGLIAEKHVDNYQFVQAREPIVSLQDLTQVDIVINVPQNAMIQARKTQVYSVTARFDSLPGHKFPLNFKEVSTKADPQTQTYAVTLTMPMPDDATILPGMTAAVDVSLGDPDSDQSFLVPVDAVFAGPENNSFVWVIDPDQLTVHKTEVELGDMAGDSVVVNGGLEKGDRVVTAGVGFLHDGQKIRLMSDEGGRE